MLELNQMSALSEPKICDICHKPIGSGVARSNVTQYLFDESRCQCILPERQAIEDAEKAYLQTKVREREEAANLKLVTSTADTRVPRAGAADGVAQDRLERIKANLPERYEIMSLIGQGGMGVVVRAFDHEENRPVAIKVMRPQFIQNAEALMRFEKEAKLASGLKHPNIAAVYDHGVGKEGAPYLVMELVEGEGLDRIYARECPLKPKRAVELCIQIANALQAAHEKGILHRDVKPENILVSKVGNEEIARLVDFGIAKSIDPVSGMGQAITQTGQLVGSPKYMSPEQCQGQKIDCRSDIYSLGCVLYEGLCGQTPFDSDNALRVLLQHIEEQAPPVVSKSKQLISDDLNYIVMRCLDKYPSNRYPTASKLAEDLEKRRTGQKIEHTNNEDYSPVHLLKSPYTGSSLPVSTVSYSKSGWEESTNQTLPVALIKANIFFIPFVIAFVAALIFGISAGHSLVQSRIPVDPTRLDTRLLLKDKEMLRKAIMVFEARGQEALAAGKYGEAVPNFSKLNTLLGDVKADKEIRANNLYCLAHSQMKEGLVTDARQNYKLALKLFKEARSGGPLDLSSLAQHELESCSEKTAPAPAPAQL